MFSLPGGGADGSEHREQAAIRELREETGLETLGSRFLFEHQGRRRKSHHGGFYRDDHKVFLLTTAGTPRPYGEVTEVAYTDGSAADLEPTAREIIERYLATTDAPSTSGDGLGRLQRRRRRPRPRQSSGR